MMSCTSNSGNRNSYFPEPDSLGGWRSLTDAKKIEKQTGIDIKKLDSAFNFIRGTTRNGGLLVLRNGWLVYENYFGKGERNANPNLASCGKSFTSMSIGIFLNEHPELFPDGLDQKIFNEKYLPAKAFPLPDKRMEDIKLGQLLAFSAGIRGNNPVYINGVRSSIDTVGPDGWFSVVDDYALGIRDSLMNGKPFTTKTLWCEPGGGYSYATASIHIASIMLRQLSGMELDAYIQSHIAEPLGWGRWGYGYRGIKLVTHTPGGGGIALHSTDMLRFGYLLLNEGRWGDKQIIPQDYVKKATSASPYNPHFPYSFQFDVNTNGEISTIPRDAFWKTGSGGHCLFVVPSLGLVVWKLGGRDGQYNEVGFPRTEEERTVNKFGPTEKLIPLDGTEYTKTLELVISSIVDKDK